LAIASITVNKNTAPNMNKMDLAFDDKK